MKKCAAVLAVIVGVCGLVGQVGLAAPSRTDVPPILLNGEDGTLGLFVYLGPSAENTSVPMMGTIPVKVCDGTDCETYTGNYLSDNEGYSQHRSINAQISIGVRFTKRAVTTQVPSDLVDGSKGWSTASNAVTGWTDSQAWFRSRSTRPVLEVQFRSIESSSLSRADLCSNYREGATLSKSISGYSAFDLTGYTTLKYVLTENGAQVKTEDLSSLMTGMTSIPACGGGIMGSGVMKTIEGLSAGKSYKLTYTLSGAGKTDVTATLDFITPGGCPSGEIVLPPSPRAFYYGVIGADGYLKSYLATGTYPWRIESVLGDRLAPIYFSASKVGPYKGKLLNVRTSTEKWRYIKEVDDWALVIDNATPISASGLLAYTVFADCTTSSLKATLSLDEASVKSADQACVITNNEVVPTKAGQCLVKAQVPASAVSASSVGKSATTNVVTMNYVFSSVGTFSTTSTTTSASSSVLAGSSSSSCSVTLTSAKQTASNSSLLKCVGLSVKRGETVSIKTATSKVCTTTKTGISRRTKGACKITVRVMNKSKVMSSKSLTIQSK